MLLAACGNGGVTPPADAPAAADACSGFVGDPARPVEVEILVRDAAGAVGPVADGADVPLVQPPQGGKVIFAGVRARNLDTCGPVQILGSVRDGTAPTDRIVGLDGRPIDLVPAGDGWAESREPMQLSSYANIPVCPNHTSSRDLFGEDYQLTVSVLDSDDRRGSRSVIVRPFCAEPQHEAGCLCTCKQGYRLGEQCPGDPPPDAGPTR
jgi:hypothetical protein